jgi:hypothetical protein
VIGESKSNKFELKLAKSGQSVSMSQITQKFLPNFKKHQILRAKPISAKPLNVQGF